MSGQEIRIAFCSSEWNYDVITSATVGIHRFLQRHADAKVITFRELGRFGTRDAARGDHEIFTLAQPELFQGFVIQGNQVWSQAARTEFVKPLREAGIPIVSINYAIEGTTYIGTDNLQAVCDMTKGILAQVRAKDGCEETGIAFVRGLSRSLEARDRELGFLEGCRQMQVEERKIRIFDGSWSAEEGEACARALLEDREHLPRVLICANDDLAGGAARVLLDAGVRVPEDIVITGFDNLDVSEAFRPRLISVERDYTGTIETAMETAYQIIKTGEQKAVAYSPYRILYQECLSDGTPMAEASVARLKDEIWELRQKSIRDKHAEHRRYLLQDQIEPALLSCRKMGEILDVFEQFMRKYGEGSCYIAINTDYRYGNERAGEIRHYSDKMALAAIVGKEQHNYISNPITHCYEVFDKTAILPEALMEGKGLLDVLPLHYGEICIGYLVLESKADYIDYACMESINTLLVNAMENARTRALLQKINDKLEEMYMRDSLTGLYNRYGLDTEGRSYFDKLNGRREISFWFIDMDNMKGINDCLGHEAGDAAIASLGRAVKTVADTYGLFAMRYGGDEFLMFGSELPERIRKELQAEIAKIHLTRQDVEWDERGRTETDLPMERMCRAKFRADGSVVVAASVGVYTVGVQECIPLETCISMADTKMYEDKKRRKRGISENSK